MKQRKSMKASLEHYVFSSELSGDDYVTIVALHGRGADAHDLVPLIEALQLEEVLLIAPRAPLPLNLGFVQGYAWYDLGEEGVPDPRTFSPNLDHLRKFLREIKSGYRVGRLILFGFSQGTVMAYAVGLTDPASVSGIVALSGYIPSRSDLPLQWDKLSGLPVFVSHGEYDEIISVELGRETAEMLRRAGADVVYREYPMGHEVSEQTLRDLAAWMKKVL